MLGGCINGSPLAAGQPLHSMRIFPLSVLFLILSLGVFPFAAEGADDVHSAIDKAIAAAADGPLAPSVSDAEFLRRAYLDFSGTIPTSTDARQFLADKDSAKRAKLIDRLIAAPEFSERMEKAVTVMLLERKT